MASRSTLKRLGAAILGSAFVLMSALPAAAAEKPKVEPERPDEPGMGIWLERSGQLLDGNPDQDGTQPFNAELIGLRITTGDSNERAKAYCVELPTRLYDGKPLEEVPWGEHPNPETKFKENAGRINWILQNSYPKLSIEDARALYGVGEAKRSILITAAQAAIWHFSDGVDLRVQDSTAEDEDTKDGTVDELVYKSYKYLVDNAQDLAEPKPTLDVDPAQQSGEAGDRIGPFTISTTADEVKINANLPEGVKLVDAEGNAPGAATAGAAASDAKTVEVWVQVDKGVAPGSVEFTVEAEGELRSGRLFVSVDKNDKTQSLVIAWSEPVKVQAKAKADWVEAPAETTQPSTPSETTSATPTTTTAAPTTTTSAVVAGGGDTDELASTGASIFVPLLIGLGLLGAGAAALLVVRRKRTA
ncbi:thioester domain-containing protein [Actinosynnema sp. NPDC059797]